MKRLDRIKHSAWFFPLMVTMVSLPGNAQTASASFGTVYAQNGTQTTVNVPIQGTYAVRGQFYGSGSTQTSVGTVSAPSSFYGAGNGQNISIPIAFVSNSTSGTLSASFTAHYTCSGSCTQSSLSVSVSANGQNVVATATAGKRHVLMSPAASLSTGGYTLVGWAVNTFSVKAPSAPVWIYQR